MTQDRFMLSPGSHPSMTPFTVDPADSFRRVFKPGFRNQQRKPVSKGAVKARQDELGRQEHYTASVQHEHTSV